MRSASDPAPLAAERWSGALQQGCPAGLKAGRYIGQDCRTLVWRATAGVSGRREPRGRRGRVSAQGNGLLGRSYPGPLDLGVWVEYPAVRGADEADFRLAGSRIIHDESAGDRLWFNKAHTCTSVRILRSGNRKKLSALEVFDETL